jgi:hypothetical protein
MPLVIVVTAACVNPAFAPSLTQVVWLSHATADRTPVPGALVVVVEVGTACAGDERG